MPHKLAFVDEEEDWIRHMVRKPKLRPPVSRPHSATVRDPCTPTYGSSLSKPSWIPPVKNNPDTTPKKEKPLYLLPQTTCKYKVAVIHNGRKFTPRFSAWGLSQGKSGKGDYTGAQLDYLDDYMNRKGGGRRRRRQLDFNADTQQTSGVSTQKSDSATGTVQYNNVSVVLPTTVSTEEQIYSPHFKKSPVSTSISRHKRALTRHQQLSWTNDTDGAPR
eukprot:TRINITY_DN67997_c9_g1_i1.p1 TRINITY_DN67997_c9_g1~~TRINITY_DN67997_c9_g1_i1.p1  ORF type:complete len:218 (-),score=25.76 TRINITY_DN67997_c9_g1_i1:272-925(-)